MKKQIFEITLTLKTHGKNEYETTYLVIKKIIAIYCPLFLYQEHMELKTLYMTWIDMAGIIAQNIVCKVAKNAVSNIVN